MNDFEKDVPVVEDFWDGVRAEKEHQLKRWGTTHDRNKAPADWFWLLGYLSGKALAAAIKGDREKALHHCISSAAVLANWHDAIASGGLSLKVEHEPSQQLFAENPDPTRPSDLEKHLGVEDAPKTITVNGQAHILRGETLSWAALMLLVELSEEAVASVTYKGPGARGILHPGEALRLVDGLRVEAYVTGSA